MKCIVSHRPFIFLLLGIFVQVLVIPVQSFASPANGKFSQPNRNFPMSVEQTKNNENKDTIMTTKTKTVTTTPSDTNQVNNSEKKVTMTKTSSFPTQDLLPKSETKADVFQSNYPNYDGRGITVGILDTGVDPGAIGLSQLPPHTTSSSSGNGETSCMKDRKLIHVADCTGSGDIAMNVKTVALKKDHGWVITKNVYGEDISDDPIILNPDLNLKPFPEEDEKEETNKEESKKGDDTKKEGDEKEKNEDDSVEKMPIRLGFKRLYELYPKKLTARVRKHVARQFVQEQQRHAVEIRQKIATFQEKFQSKQPTPEELREKEDLVALLDVLEGKKLKDSNKEDPLVNDPGPLCQVIMFYDGENYRVLIDLDNVSMDGESDDTASNSGGKDLSQVPVSEAMTDYYKEGQYRTFTHIDMCNYAVNIYQNGKVVSVVVDAGAHGSHVAGITARYQPDGESTEDEKDEEPNGVAPGAKLISFKIGDSRLGSMETGSALTRALIEAVKHKCDVINLSYGEGCSLPNSGRFVQLAEELVHKHGIVFVSSAGNNGPALTTVGAPGGTTDAIIGVAAYVSAAMMKAKYCAPKDENDGTTFTWSSVGPTADGAQGVDVMAPGGAITCVPNWCLQRNQLMNGTSMSSPNAAGCIALLLSAAKAEGINVTPARLKCALMNCAQGLNGLSCLQQGAGMINVQKTWEYLKQFKDDPYGDVSK